MWGVGSSSWGCIKSGSDPQTVQCQVTLSFPTSTFRRSLGLLSVALAASTTHHGNADLDVIIDSILLLQPSAMSCQICATSHSRQSFLCPTCARNRLYQLRLENAQNILEKEALARQIELAALGGDSPSQPSTAERSSSGSHQGRFWCRTLQTISSRQAGSVHRRDNISRQIEALKGEIKAKKDDIAERKEVLTRRRSDAESAQYQLEEREAANLTSIQNTTKRTEHLWHSLHSKTAEARIFLCREAAHLYGLRQKTAKKDDTRQIYMLGGISIVDLRDMNGKSTSTS